MKILHVIPYVAPRYGGSNKAVLEMCKELARKGQEVSLFTTNIDGKQRLDVPLGKLSILDGVRIWYFPVQGPRYLIFSFSMMRALQREISNFDIVHVSAIYSLSALVAAYYCWKYGKPYVVHVSGDIKPYLLKHHWVRKRIYWALFLGRILKRAAAIHYKCEQEKRIAESIMSKTPGVVVPNGIFPSAFSHLPAYGSFRRKYPELKGKKVVLFLSRINYIKGLDILASAFEKVARKRKDVLMVLAGPDNEGFGEKVKGWLRAGGVLDRVSFTGMLLGEDKLSVLRDSDLFVLPSYSENFGIAVVEAMACGLPVIISNKVDICREVDEAGAGIVIDCEPDQIANAILRLLDNPELRKEMGKKGRKLVEERYTWDKASDKMIEVYQIIVNKM